MTEDSDEQSAVYSDAKFTRSMSLNAEKKKDNDEQETPDTPATLCGPPAGGQIIWKQNS